MLVSSQAKNLSLFFYIYSVNPAEIQGRTSLTQFNNILAKVILKQNLTWNMFVLLSEFFF